MSTAVQRVPRGVARDRVRRALLAAARALFDEIGFDAATTAEIAARAGVSQRTLFRHFSCKEGVVLDWMDDWNLRVCERLRRRPADEPVLEALRRAVDPFCHMPAEDSERSRWARGLAEKTPTVKARLLTKQAEWEGHIAEALVERGVAPTRAAFLGNFAFGILSVAHREAAGQTDRSFEDAVDEGFSYLRGRTAARPASNDR